MEDCGLSRSESDHIYEVLKDKLKIEFLNEEQLGINFDYIESELIAYLSARSIYNLPFTFPSTTGVSKPSSGGDLYKFYKKPCWFSMWNGLNFNGDGKISLISEKGNEGTKLYASAYWPFGELHWAAL